MRINFKYFLFLYIIFSFFHFVYSQELPKIRTEDRIRIAEAVSLNNELVESVWKNWSKTEFSILLVDSNYEFLIYNSSPSGDFKSLYYDSLLKSDIYYRPRQFQENFRATFPAVNNIATVVIGIPEKTNKSSTDWVITLLHEHFHQYQMSQTDYFESVNALELSHGDKTGMWMLNYDFPYSVDSVNDEFNILCKNLVETIGSLDSENFMIKAKGYYEERNRFTGMLKSDDYKYFSFQLWQEGIARYIELKIAQNAAENYLPSNEMQSLHDYTSYKYEAEKINSGILKNLRELTLSYYKRIAFYYIGAGEAILLDKINPVWKDKYFSNKFYLENYINN